MYRTIQVILISIVLVSGSRAQEFTFSNVPFRGMGFVTGINAHPNDPSYVVVRTDVGGNYRWDAENSKWIPLLDAFNAPGVSADALCESNPGYLYSVASGPLFLKSTNKGDSWMRMEGFPDIHVNANTNFYRWGGKRLVVDPNNGGKVIYYASESDGLWRSPNQGTNWQQVSTTQVPTGIVGGNIFVAIDKSSGTTSQNSQLVYVGVQGRGVYKSSNSGQAWSVIPGGPDSTVYYPVSGVLASNGTLYVTYSTQASEWVDGSEGRVYKYAGDSLENITPVTNNSLGFNGIDVAFDDPNKLIALQWKPGLDKGIHFSTNGGESWSARTLENRSEPSWYPGYSPWTYTGQIMFDKDNSDRVWYVNGFGVYFTQNIKVASPSWTTRMNNLEELVAGQVHVPPVPGGKAVFSLVMDKVAFVHTKIDQVPSSGVFGQEFGIGTGMDYCVANPSVTAVVGSQQGNVSLPRHRYTTNNGQTWSAFPSIPADFNNGSIAISATDENLWVWAPNNETGSLPNVQMHYTEDMGKNWFASSGIPSIRNGATHSWAQSIVLVSDRVNGDNFYYYLRDDENSLYRSQDGGKSFNKVYSGLPSDHHCRLKAVPYKEGHLFFHANGQLVHSKDKGETWSQVPGVSGVGGIGFGKPIPPSSEPAIYIAATIDSVQAIYLSTDYGENWTNISLGKIPAGKVRDISGDLRLAGRVYFATGGRGVMYGDAGFATRVFSLTTKEPSKMVVYPNPLMTSELNIDFAFPVSQGKVKVFNQLGKSMLVQEVNQEHSTRIDMQNMQPGLYLVRVEMADELFNEAKVLIVR